MWPQRAAGKVSHLPSLRWGERIETGLQAGPEQNVPNLPSLRWGERIETAEIIRLLVSVADLPSLRWGERIETYLPHPVHAGIIRISPHFGGGSGLKHEIHKWILDYCRSPLTSVGGAD